MKAQEFVEGAMRKLRVKKLGFNPTAEEMANGLQVLNTMLKAWAAESLIVPCRTTETLGLTAGANPHTIGVGAMLDTVEPIQISTAVLREGTSDWPLDQKTADFYARVHLKSLPGRPNWFYYERGLDAGAAQGRIYFDFVPDAAYTLVLQSLKPFQTFSSLTADDVLPDEYEAAIVFNLAVDMAPEWGKEPSPTVQRRAHETYLSLKHMVAASRVPVIKTDPVLRRRRRFHIDVID